MIHPAAANLLHFLRYAGAVSATLDLEKADAYRRWKEAGSPLEDNELPEWEVASSSVGLGPSLNNQHPEKAVAILGPWEPFWVTKTGIIYWKRPVRFVNDNSEVQVKR